MFNIFGMIPGSEVRVLDRNAEFYGVKTSVLMENAGRGVADFIEKLLGSENVYVLVFCGTGNNGGDGFVAARYLAERYRVAVFLAGRENEIKTDVSRNNFVRLKKIGVEIYDIDSMEDVDRLLSQSSVVVDALLGIGLSGRLRDPYGSLVKKIMSKKRGFVVSVDVPTGLGTDVAVKPDYTITFHDIKHGMSRENSGEIRVVDIGIPEEAVRFVGPGELSVYYPRPKKESHKGENGVVLIVGGGPYIGAPALSGLAALRTGADLVFIATPSRSWRAAASFSPNLIVRELFSNDMLTVDDIPVIKDLLVRCDGVVVGPGLGDKSKTLEAAARIIEITTRMGKQLVVDADAIKALSRKTDVVKNSNTIVTPHAGEFKKLTGKALSTDIDKRIMAVKQWAEKLGVTILLKGPVDIVSDGIDVKLNKTHNEAMTVGGTGDVLSGILGALLSKGVKPFNAARIGVFLNGYAGNEAFKKKSYGLLATDIIEEIPHVLKKYL
ncbi:MAG: bifunctional ADP-dependent NAD(P)H-hydrate dehydratase/NAD(P)H-hydrate epimerase [Thermoplasmata archaeon]|nr:MAG: bifunctional ADP-dependent NAD(P)H-hydrate dehydratase/NAD(P)H-hydrate epimerase [Thermoplasmata archaeon]